MNHIQFATCLIRMSRYKIGISEAATLFCLGGGSTTAQVAKACGVHPATAKGRVGALMAKRLATSYRTPSDVATYRPTERGLALIKETLAEKEGR
jgi:DNA-binding MarR family transcriptional regulator